MTSANLHFGSSLGSGSFYRHTLTGSVYTDGVRDLAEGCQAYWLLDLIISHQTTPKVSCEPFQVWDLARVRENRFRRTCNDGNEKDLTSHQIPFSDFPYDKATIWLVDGCLLLPTEY
ncbi:MAG: DUF6876 family protein [Flavisolibacter sp.]